MNELEIYIVNCPVNSYKLTGEGISEYHEEALERANDLYLSLYENIYKKLMFKDFNPLWTPDTKSINDIDPKDGFWAMNYFFFNVCLIRIISEKRTVKITDKTTSEFRNQTHFFRFLDYEGIGYKVIREKNKTSFKNSLKKLAKRSVKNLGQTISNNVRFLRNEFAESGSANKEVLKKKPDQKFIYLTIPHIGSMSIKSYLEWHYSKLFKLLKYHEKEGHKVVLVSSKGFKDSDTVGYPFINTFKLVSRRDLLNLFAKSVQYKLKVIWRIRRELKQAGITPLQEYFIKNIPTKLYYALKEDRAFYNLFKRYGSGLLIVKGPIVYKGVYIHTQNARKNNVRVLSVAGRILTSTRLTNCFVDVHEHKQFPKVLPHSIIVTDRVSYDSIHKQGKKIKLYYMPSDIGHKIDRDTRHNPFTVTLALQKKNEMVSMIDEVLAGIRDFDNIALNLKMHPNFSMPNDLRKKYAKFPFINILPIDTTLSEAVNVSDLCITAYSTSAFEFLRKSRPIVWINNVTFNSLFFSDVQKKMGLVAKNATELKDIIRKLKDNSGYYREQQQIQRSQFREFVSAPENEEEKTFNSIIAEELEKI